LAIAERLGILLMTLDQWPEAERAFRYTMTELHSSKDVPNLVISLIAQGKTTEARNLVASRLATSPSAGDELAAAILSQAENDRERHLHHLYRALELRPTETDTCGVLLVLLHTARDISRAREAAKLFIVSKALRSEGLGMASMLVLQASLTGLYPDAVAWAQEFIATGIEVKDGNLLLVLALTRLKRWGEIWAPLEAVLADESFTARHLHDLVPIFSLAAAHGHARRAADVLAASPSASRLEPLAVALARILGEATNPPQEVSEVADDIGRDIERLQQALTTSVLALNPTGTGTSHRGARRTRRKSRDAKLG
jgi:hypothetical protein